MFRILALVFLTAYACLAQQQYRFFSLTGTDIHRFATGKMLTENGAAIASLDAVGRPAVVSPTLGTIAPAFSQSITGINASGDIIGYLYGYPPGSFLSHPPYNTYIDISDLFGTGTFTAPAAMNDLGDIIGMPFSNTSWFPGLDISNLVAINNAGQVIGATLAGTTSNYFLYTPGAGVTPLLSFPMQLNNRGHVLISTGLGAFFIQSENGQTPLPAGYVWTGINDRDEAVGFQTANGIDYVPVYYSTSTGLVNLSDRYQNTQNLVFVAPAGINNSGEILVNYRWMPFPTEPVAPSAGIGLLIPVSSGTPTQPAGFRPTPRRQIRSVNGKPVKRVTAPR